MYLIVLYLIRIKNLEDVMLNSELLNKLLDDVVSDDDNNDKLHEILFSNDDGIDQEPLILFFEDRVNELYTSSKIDKKGKEELLLYLNVTRTDEKNYTIFLTLLMKKFFTQNYNNDKCDFVYRINKYMFWCYYAISIKKCLNAPFEKIILHDYRKYVKNGTPQQEDARTRCVSSFNLNSSDFKVKELPMLSLFSIPIRSVKKNKIKKKNINRILKKAKRIMQIIKIRDYNAKAKYNIFQGKAHLIPEEFSSYVIKNFVN